ncbi:MAG: hypothetical protein K2H60_13470, partial [Muribaculaceae bacterium]|nr:hypothetical protein [Muribaculaceae bacterium]
PILLFLSLILSRFELSKVSTFFSSSHITKGSDFARCVRYALALDESGKEAHLLHSESLLTDTPQDIIDGFECQRHLNKTDKGDDFHIKHRIQHLAIAFSKAHYDHPNAVKTADITCIRLY